jgi:hypothetical protein
VVVPGGDAAASGGGEDDADEDGGEYAGVEEDDPIIYSFSLSLADEFGFEEGPVDVLNIMRLFFCQPRNKTGLLDHGGSSSWHDPPLHRIPPLPHPKRAHALERLREVILL